MWASHYGADAQPPLRLDGREGVHDARRATSTTPTCSSQFFGMDQATSMDEFIDVHAHGQRHPVGEHDGHVGRRPGVVRRRRRRRRTCRPRRIAAWQAERRRRRAGQDRARQRGDPARRLEPDERVGRRPGRDASRDPPVRPAAAARARRLRVQRQRLALAGQPGRAAHRLLAAHRARGGPAVGAHADERRAAHRPGRARRRRRCSRSTSCTAAILSQRSCTPSCCCQTCVAACDARRVRAVDERALRPHADRATCSREWDGRYTSTPSAPCCGASSSTLFAATAIGSTPATLYSVAFDPADPVGTPNTLNDDDDLAILTNLGIAAQGARRRRLRLSTPPSATCSTTAGHRRHRIPLPGGFGPRRHRQRGRLLLRTRRRSARRATRARSPTRTSSSRDTGYPVTDGNSFMMTRRSSPPTGPIAEGVLTYGQPDDPADPTSRRRRSCTARASSARCCSPPDEIAADAVSTLTVTGDQS